MAAIVGSRYCDADNVTDIGVVRSVLVRAGEPNIFLVTDTNNNVIFRVQKKSTLFHTLRVLLDSNVTPVVTFCPKFWTIHRRWRAFLGGKTQKRNLIFSAKSRLNKNSLSDYSDMDLLIYLPNNNKEKFWDYKVDKSFVFYNSDNLIIAEAKEHMVKICPNVDMAFIVSLIVILDGIKEQEVKSEKNLDRIISATYLLDSI